MREAAGSYDSGIPRCAAVSWSFYVRWCFESGCFFQFAGLDASNDLFLYVVENKSLPGRTAPAVDAAYGRPLCVSWFRTLDDSMSGKCVVPVDTSSVPGHLDIIEATVAEICRAAGDHVAAAPTDSARDVELTLERRLVNHQVVRFHSERVSNDAILTDYPWAFILTSPIDFETVFIQTRQINELTKMSLARQIQLNESLTGDQRDKLWEKSWDTLAAAYVQPHSAHAGAAALEPKGKGRGAAKGGPHLISCITIHTHIFP